MRLLSIGLVVVVACGDSSDRCAEAVNHAVSLLPVPKGAFGATEQMIAACRAEHWTSTTTDCLSKATDEKVLDVCKITLPKTP